MQKGDEEKNLGIPSGKVAKDISLEAAPWRYVETATGARVEVDMYRIEAHWSGLGNTDEIRGIMRKCAAAPALYAALKEVLNVMEIQENRDSGVFHLHVDAFRPMWDSAGLAGHTALALVNDQVTQQVTER